MLIPPRPPTLLATDSLKRKRKKRKRPSPLLDGIETDRADRRTEHDEVQESLDGHGDAVGIVGELGDAGRALGRPGGRGSGAGSWGGGGGMGEGTWWWWWCSRRWSMGCCILTDDGKARVARMRSARWKGEGDWFLIFNSFRSFPVTAFTERSSSSSSRWPIPSSSLFTIPFPSPSSSPSSSSSPSPNVALVANRVIRTRFPLREDPLLRNNLAPSDQADSRLGPPVRLGRRQEKRDRSHLPRRPRWPHARHLRPTEADDWRLGSESETVLH
ncbi:hypothetical protein KC322_g88 [Hortaea werneckii]|nr:hypothetical protein KC322_g88 [Hortaea werneckii]